MRIMGAPCAWPGPVLDALVAAMRDGRAGLLFSDGEDCIAVVADEGDTAAEVVHLSREHVEARA